MIEFTIGWNDGTYGESVRLTDVTTKEEWKEAMDAIYDSFMADIQFARENHPAYKGVAGGIL